MGNETAQFKPGDKVRNLRKFADGFPGVGETGIITFSKPHNSGPDGTEYTVRFQATAFTTRDWALFSDEMELAPNAPDVVSGPALLAERDALKALLAEAIGIIARANEAFYLGGSSKQLKPVMAETKPFLQKAREAL